MKKLFSLIFFLSLLGSLSACSLFKSPALMQKANAKKHELQKDYAGAAEIYSNLIKANPKDSDALTSRGHCKYHLSDYKGAIQDFEKAIAINSLDGRAYDLKGLCEYRLKDYKAAIEDFEKAITIDPDNAHTNEDLGNCYKQVNDLPQAMSHLTKAKELYKKRGAKADIARVEKMLSEL